MKRKMKNWIFMSMLFVGISLTVYAVAPEVFITSITVNNVTATTADIVIEHVGAVSFLFEVYHVDNNTATFYFSQILYTGADDPNGEASNKYTITSLLPDTEYLVRIKAGGFPDMEDFENVDYAEQIAAFRTAWE